MARPQRFESLTLAQFCRRFPEHCSLLAWLSFLSGVLVVMLAWIWWANG